MAHPCTTSGSSTFVEWAGLELKYSVSGFFSKMSRKSVLGARFRPFGVEWYKFVVNDFGIPKVNTSLFNVIFHDLKGGKYYSSWFRKTYYSMLFFIILEDFKK